MKFHAYLKLIAVFVIVLLTIKSGFVGASEKFMPQWSENPGTYEAHLRLRNENPIFHPSRREISDAEFEQARSRDRAALVGLQKSFEDFLGQLSSSPKQIGASELDGFRRRIDDLLDEAAAVGAPATEIQANLVRLRSSLMHTWFAGLTNPQAIRALREAEAASEARARVTHNPHLAQLQVIPAEDVVPTLLTLEPAMIELFLLTVDPSIRSMLATEAGTLVREMHGRGEDIPGIDKRLATLTVLRPNP